MRAQSAAPGLAPGTAAGSTGNGASLLAQPSLFQRVVELDRARLLIIERHLLRRFPDRGDAIRKHLAKLVGDPRRAAEVLNRFRQGARR